MAVDSTGGVAYDPSANVLSLVDAAVRRLDDLRAAETRRQDDLRVQSDRHAAEVARLTSDFQEKLRDAEAKRIDAIRAVDVNAVSVASVRAADQATVLASQVQVSADALRSLVATSASTLAAAQAASTAEITKRLSELERSKYEGAGRSAVADPQTDKLAALVEKLATAQSTTTGKSAGINAAWVVAVGAIMLVLAIASFFGLRSTPPSQPVPQPEIRYLPLPSTQPTPTSVR